MHSFRAWIVSDLIEKYRDGCAIIYRFHHCMADGISMLKILRTALEPVDAPTSATKAKPVVAEPSVSANASSKSLAPSSATATAATKSSSGASAIKRTRTGLCERVSIFFGAFSKLLLLAADPITALRSATCLPSFGSRKARWLEPYIEVRSSCNFVMLCMFRGFSRVRIFIC
jgi:diacylglycerol O-acyltransferase